MSGNDSAFPTVDTDISFDQGSGRDHPFVSSKGGLTKRELFAAQILTGLVVPAIAGSHNGNNEVEARHKCEMAVRLADALLAELAKERK